VNLKGKKGNRSGDLKDIASGWLHGGHGRKETEGSKENEVKIELKDILKVSKQQVGGVLGLGGDGLLVSVKEDEVSWIPYYFERNELKISLTSWRLLLSMQWWREMKHLLGFLKLVPSDGRNEWQCRSGRVATLCLVQ
jgi:hypothetical protein